MGPILRLWDVTVLEIQSLPARQHLCRLIGRTELRELSPRASSETPEPASPAKPSADLASVGRAHGSPAGALQRPGCDPSCCFPDFLRLGPAVGTARTGRGRKRTVGLVPFRRGWWRWRPTAPSSGRLRTVWIVALPWGPGATNCDSI